jgi:hypothetical protein
MARSVREARNGVKLKNEQVARVTDMGMPPVARRALPYTLIVDVVRLAKMHVLVGRPRSRAAALHGELWEPLPADGADGWSAIRFL